jgi:hypothetical protein
MNKQNDFSKLEKEAEEKVKKREKKRKKKMKVSGASVKHLQHIIMKKI